MLARLQHWYVFRIYQNASYTVYFGIFIGVFILVFSLDNLFKSYGLDLGRWFWTFGVAIETIILLNVWFYSYLKDNIEIHEKAEDDKWERYFLAIEKDECEPIFCRKGDFFVAAKSDDFELSHLYFPLVKDREICDLKGLIPKKIGDLEVSFFCQEGSTRLDVIVYLKRHYDIHEIVNFVCRQYRDTCRVYDGYEDYVMDMLETASHSKWTNAAQETVRSKHYAEKTWGNKSGPTFFEDDDERCDDENLPVSEALHEYLQLIRKNFKPLLLSNVDHIEVEIAGSEEAIKIGEEEPQKVEQPAGLKKKQK